MAGFVHSAGPAWGWKPSCRPICARRRPRSVRMSGPGAVDGRGFSVPTVGDVVIVPGRWPGEEAVGIVDRVGTRIDKTSAVVDVVELRSVGGSMYANARKLQKKKIRSYDVAEVRAAPSTYVASQDAYRVEDVRDGFPDPNDFDEDSRAEAMEAYRQLKAQQLRDGAVTGLAGSFAMAVLAGPVLGGIFAGAAACGVGYLAMLQKATDRVERGQGPFVLRFLLPVLPFLIVAEFGGPDGLARPSELLWSLPREQVLAASMGFLSFRLPLFWESVRELLSQVQSTKVKPRGTMTTLISLAQNRSSDDPEAAAGATGSTLVISGCSGVGKSTLIRQLLSEFPDSLGFSVSYTTRDPRPSERDGVDYRFISKEAFERKIEAGDFVEWAEVYSNYYGTAVDAIREVVDDGRVCLLDVDVQGAQRVSESDIGPTKFVWIAPPSMDALEERLRGRSTEDKDTTQLRLSKAVGELEFAATSDLFDHTIVNADVGEAYARLRQIFVGQIAA